MRGVTIVRTVLGAFVPMVRRRDIAIVGRAGRGGPVTNLMVLSCGPATELRGDERVVAHFHRLAKSDEACIDAVDGDEALGIQEADGRSVILLLSAAGRTAGGREAVK